MLQQISVPDDVIFEGLMAARVVSERASTKVCVAIVDAAGELSGFVRQPGAFLVSSDLAIDKAWTAAGFRLSTREFGALLAQKDEGTRKGLLARPRVTRVPGGLPIFFQDQCLGGIGVSGAGEEEDEAIAAAALAAIEEKLR